MCVFVYVSMCLCTIKTHQHLELDSSTEIELANISMLVMKKRLGREEVSHWDSKGSHQTRKDEKLSENSLNNDKFMKFSVHFWKILIIFMMNRK